MNVSVTGGCELLDQGVRTSWGRGQGGRGGGGDSWACSAARSINMMSRIDFKYCTMSSAAAPTYILLPGALQRRKKSNMRWNFQVCRTVKSGCKVKKKSPASDQTETRVIHGRKLFSCPVLLPFSILWRRRLAVCSAECWLVDPAVTHLVLQLVLSNIGFNGQGLSIFAVLYLQNSGVYHGGGEPHLGPNFWVSGKWFCYFPLVALMHSCFKVVMLPSRYRRSQMLTVVAARHACVAFAAALSAGNGACCWCSKNVNTPLFNRRLGWIHIVASHLLWSLWCRDACSTPGTTGCHVTGPGGSTMLACDPCRTQHRLAQ